MSEDNYTDKWVSKNSRWTQRPGKGDKFKKHKSRRTSDKETYDYDFFTWNKLNKKRLIRERRLKERKNQFSILQESSSCLLTFKCGIRNTIHDPDLVLTLEKGLQRKKKWKPSECYICYETTKGYITHCKKNICPQCIFNNRGLLDNKCPWCRQNIGIKCNYIPHYLAYLL